MNILAGNWELEYDIIKQITFVVLANWLLIKREIKKKTRLARSNSFARDYLLVVLK